MLKHIFSLILILVAAPAWAEFTSADWIPMTTNGGFESAIGSEWTCTGCTVGGRTSSPSYEGSYSYNMRGTNATLDQNITVTTNTSYVFSAHVRDSVNNAGTTFKIMSSSVEEQATTPVANPNFENALGSEWQCSYVGVSWFSCEDIEAKSSWRVSTPVQNGTYSIRAVPGHYDWDDYDEEEHWWRARIYQNITIDTNTQYTIKAWVRDTTASAGVRMFTGGSSQNCDVSSTASSTNEWVELTCVIPNTNTTASKTINFEWTTTLSNATDRFYVDNITVTKTATIYADLCSISDTPSNINVWTALTCTVPITNTATNLKLRLVSPDNTNTFYIDKVQQWGENNITFRLPASSSGRVVKLFDSNGRVSQTKNINSDNIATFSGVSDGYYYWFVTDIDGETFLDSSTFISMSPSSESKIWTWTNTNLSKDVVTTLTLKGDDDLDGNCLNNGSTGCYHTITRGGTDYTYLGPAFGSNLAAGKTVTVSSGSNASNITDGNPNTYWEGANGSSNEYACIDLGSVTTFNTVIARNRLTDTNNLPGSQRLGLHVSSSDTGCGAGDFSIISETERVRREKQQIIQFSFAPQIKRYLRLVFLASSGSNHRAWEVEVYNEGTSNPASDINSLILQKDSDYSITSLNGIRYDSYITESDGSKTFSKSISGGTLTVNYKKIANTWRKRFKINMTSDHKMTIDNVVQKYLATDTNPCVHIRPFNGHDSAGNPDAIGVKSCNSYASTGAFDGSSNLINGGESGYIGNNIPPTFGIGFPYFVIQSNDNGCRSKDANNTDGGVPKVRERIYIERSPNWVRLGSKYGYGTSVAVSNLNVFNGSGHPYFKLKANTDYEFDVFISTPATTYNEDAILLGMAGIAEGNNKTSLDEHDRILWANAMWRYFAFDSDQQRCMQGQHYEHSGKGAHPLENLYSLIGVNDAEMFRNQIYGWRRGVPNSYASINTAQDPLSAAASFVQNGKRSWNMALMLSHAVTRGWISITANCSNTDNTCISISERDELANAIDAATPSNGEIFAGLCNITPSPALCNTTDVIARYQGEWLAAYMSLQYLGYTPNPSKLQALKDVVTGLYDSTDGYVHATKYGPWRTVSSSAASGGAYRQAETDWYAPSTARFVVPSGHSGVTAKFTAVKNSNSKYMTVKKNGSEVTGSPFDLYGNFWDTYTENYMSMNSSGGILYANIQNTTNSLMYKNVTGFSGLKKKISLRVRSLTNGPTSMNVAFYENEDCFGHDGNCYESFNNVITADGSWQTVSITMTDPQWEDSDTIVHLRFDFLGQTTTGNLLEIDWIKVAEVNDANEVVIDNFSTDGPVQEYTLSETVSTNDVLLFQLTQSSTNHSANNFAKITLDKVTIDTTNYEAENSSAFQCGDFPADCKDGYSLGWKRWKSMWPVFWEFWIRNSFGETVLSDAQVISHVGKMASTPVGNGALMSYIATEKNTPIPQDMTEGGASHTSYWDSGAGGQSNSVPHGQFNGASQLVLDGIAWTFLSERLGDLPLWYVWDDKAEYRWTWSGTWTDEFNTGYLAKDIYGTATYNDRSLWKSSTAGNYVEFKTVPYTDAKVFLITGPSQGVAKIYFSDSGGNYDSGTQVDLTTGGGADLRSTEVYSKTGLTYSSLHKIKIEVISGAVRVDYIQTKTKPSTLIDFRIKAEYIKHKVIHNWYFSDPYDSYYGGNAGYSDWTHLDIFYKGSPLQALKRKLILIKDMIFRRMPQ